MIKQGATDRETEELNRMLEEELTKQQVRHERPPKISEIDETETDENHIGMVCVEKPKPSRLGSFLNGFRKGWRKS